MISELVQFIAVYLHERSPMTFKINSFEDNPAAFASSAAFDLLFRGFFLFSTTLIDSDSLGILLSKIKTNIFEIKH